MADFLIVGLGGFFGAIARYGVYRGFAIAELNRYPFATFAINVLGCFIAGVLFSKLSETFHPAHPLYLLISMGFLGAFTTFSALGFETLIFARDGQIAFAFLHILANVAFGVSAAFLGSRVFR